MAREPDPLLEYDGDPDVTDPDDLDRLASNDDWVFQQVDRMVSRLPQRTGKDQRTEGEVFDQRTLMTLHKLLATGVLKSLDFPVSTGKEANVFRGTVPQGGHVAVKIFRTNTATFRRVLKYIQGDERFEGVGQDKRELVNAWAQKEFRNLTRMRDAGVAVPEPIRVLNNVLIMEYLGVPEGPWPTLKSLGRLDDAAPFWHALADDYVAIVARADLVHADFSEYNVLVADADDPARARPRIIDVGQAVLRSHPMAGEFLHRDLDNLTAYFRRQGLDVGPHDILRRIEARP